MCLGAIYWARPDHIYYAAQREDCSEIGFDDSMIYHEIAVPTDQRKIPTEQHDREEAVSALFKWKNYLRNGRVVAREGHRLHILVAEADAHGTTTIAVVLGAGGDDTERDEKDEKRQYFIHGYIILL